MRGCEDVRMWHMRGCEDVAQGCTGVEGKGEGSQENVGGDSQTGGVTHPRFSREGAGSSP